MQLPLSDCLVEVRRLSGESLRDRLSALSRGELIGLVAVVAALLAAAGLWYVRSLPRPVEVRAQPGVGPAAASASPSPAVLIVDVAGWVRHPGVYELGEGDRVIDALDAAGGPRRGAALDNLNLAAPLTDGLQILVPKLSGTGGEVGSASGAVPGVPAKVNVNTADATALETLPGIGEVLAQRIVDYRAENGPFASVDNLEDVSGIGPSILEEIRDLVTV